MRFVVPIVFRGQDNFIVDDPEITTPEAAAERAVAMFKAAAKPTVMGNEWQEVERVGTVEATENHEYDVHVYPVCRIKVRVAADSPQTAYQQAEDLIATKLAEIDSQLICRLPDGLHGVYFADGFDNGLVEILNSDKEVVGTVSIDPHPEEECSGVVCP